MRVETEKVRSVRALVSRATHDESNLLLVCRDMLIINYDPLLSNCSVFIVYIRMIVGAKEITLVMRSISYNMADQLTNPVCHPLVCLKFMDQFNYNCRLYYFSK